MLSNSKVKGFCFKAFSSLEVKDSDSEEEEEETRKIHKLFHSCGCD